MAERSSQVDLTPDPRVLRALTHTPLRPIDALCELIDNSIDSFAHAARSGQPINGALVVLKVPSKGDVSNGGGSVLIRDNGPGLTVADAEKSLRAGFSGNNPFDTLGLFGMGFNIASGKIGMRTRFLTVHNAARRSAVQITVDLPTMERAGHYNVPIERVAAPDGIEHGTLIEISGWWPSGNPNHDFIQKLAGIPKTKLREELGRRYATILRKRELRIIVNDDDCPIFEHCVWSSSRSVERQVWGRIPARYDLDQVTGTQTRCLRCFRRVEDGADCPDCGPGTAKRTIEERVRGWIGIQRFDDADQFGIDLIRNGRAIRVLEKEAFFTFTDELGRKYTDYPIDGPHGRIVGEIHLDHVPVDFMKQDFQRSSREWDDAMTFIRGGSSLQPKQPGADKNTSPLFRLYQGYRRVRNVGKRDLYMGSWDGEQRAGVRVSREIEREYLKKFRDRVPGYFDDLEWWKLVEAADEAPVQGIKNCPQCGSQALESDEKCSICDSILLGKKCLACSEMLPISALSCSSCGSSQLPETLTPWICAVCSSRNQQEDVVCHSCGAPAGARNPLSREHLTEVSETVPNLSVGALSVGLADGTNSTPLDVVVRRCHGPILGASGQSVPAVSVSEGAGVTIFFDPAHEAFSGGGFEIAQLTAFEVARRIQDERLALISQYPGIHTLARISWQVLQRIAPEQTSSSLRERIADFFVDVGERLRSAEVSFVETLASELTEDVEKQVVDALQAAGRPLTQFATMVQDGSLVAFLPPHFFASAFRKYPERFFDGAVFSDDYQALGAISQTTAVGVQLEVFRTYAGCLDDCAQFMTLKRNSRLLAQRARFSLEFLQRGLQ